jgi:hypothetical protein
MSPSSNELQRLTDREAIRDLLLRYFQGLDRCNPDQVRSCFTDDVRTHYDHRPPSRGIEELMSGFRTFKRIADGKMKVSTHFMGNLNFTSLEADAAETETNALAFLVEPGEGSDAVSIRSLRYIDRMRRQGNGWRISDRVHTLDWSCQVPTNFATTLAQRVSALPAR